MRRQPSDFLRARLLALFLLSLAAVYGSILAWKPDRATSLLSLTWPPLVLGAAALGGAAIYERLAGMAERHLRERVRSVVGIVYGAALFLVSLVRGELNGFDPGLVSTRSWLALAYLITFGSLIGFVAYGWLLHNAPVSLMSTYAYVNPVVAVLLGSLFADEPLNGRILLAAAIIIGSVVLINSARQAKPRVKAESLQAVPDGDD